MGVFMKMVVEPYPVNASEWCPVRKSPTCEWVVMNIKAICKRPREIVCPVPRLVMIACAVEYTSPVNVVVCISRIISDSYNIRCIVIYKHVSYIVDRIVRRD